MVYCLDDSICIDGGSNGPDRVRPLLHWRRKAYGNPTLEGNTQYDREYRHKPKPTRSCWSPTMAIISSRRHSIFFSHGWPAVKHHFLLTSAMYVYAYMFIAAEIDRLGYGHVILVRSRFGYTLDHQPQIFSISPCFQESRLGRSLRWNVKTGAMYVATMFCDLLSHWASVTMDCHLYMGQFTFGSNHYSVVQWEARPKEWLLLW